MMRFSLVVVAFLLLIAVGAPTTAAQTATNTWSDICHWESGEPWPWDEFTGNVFVPDLSSEDMQGEDHFGGAGCSWRIAGSNRISPYGAYGPTGVGPQPLDWAVLYDHVNVGWWAKSESGGFFPTTVTVLVDGVSWQSVSEADFTVSRDITVTGNWQWFELDIYPGYGREISNLRLAFSNTSGNFLVDDVQVEVSHAMQPTVTPSPSPSPSPTPTSTPTRTPLSTLTPTPTRTPNPSLNTPSPSPSPSPSASPTGTPPATGTATATALPQKSLPTPKWAAPTSIPALSFGQVPKFSLTPLAAPSPLAIAAISTPYFTPYTGTITGTIQYSDVGGVGGFVDGVLVSTLALSEETALVETGDLVVAAAPAAYAPYLPRPMADVGYTVENMSVTEQYGLRQWAIFAGYIVAMPFQLLKILYLLVQFMGPLGLFLTWLLIMVPVVLLFKLLKLVKDIIIWLLNILISIFEFNMKLLIEGIKFVIGLFL